MLLTCGLGSDFCMKSMPILCLLTRLSSPWELNLKHGPTGLNLDRLALQDIGLPEGAAAKGIARLVLTNPRWEDLRIAMSPAFSPDLKVYCPVHPASLVSFGLDITYCTLVLATLDQYSSPSLTFWF